MTFDDPDCVYDPVDECGTANNRVATACEAASTTTTSRKKLLAGFGGLMVLLLVAGSSFGSDHAQTQTAVVEQAAELYARDEPIYDVADELVGANVVLHISDTHVDPFFDPSMTMQKGVCHTCRFATKVWGDKTLCPTALPDVAEGLKVSEKYPFGRYGCNPPYRLWKSLHKHIKSIQHDPSVIVFTGDISPHGYPDDNSVVTEASTLDDFCGAKFLVTEMMVKDLAREFPNTRWAFTMGNNDHFPKNTYWQPYITKLGKMFKETGFFTAEQAEQFDQYGSNYVDVKGIRYLSIDFTLFTPGGETSFVSEKKLKDLSETDAEHERFPVRKRVIDWVERSLKDAKQKNLSVYIIGHQPLGTNGGVNEIAVYGLHYGKLKDLMTEYAPIIKVGLFGHRNIAGLAEVLSTVYSPLFPSITAPGISPRGMNQPSFHLIYSDPVTHTLLDFEQWTFNLMDENVKAVAQGVSYKGEWEQHKRDMYSWRALSNEQNFTVESLTRTMAKMPYDSKIFFALQVWKKAGYIGNEAPSMYACTTLFDTAEELMTCMFPNQNEKCWDPKWLGAAK